MHPSRIRGLLLAAWSADLLAAKTIKIEAGDVYFEPANVNASVGDVLEFHFLPHNHSVVMGDLSSPCQPAATGGFYSGFLPASSGENAKVFQVTINDTNPIVYYCSQNASSHNHCRDGMFGFVNQPNETAMAIYNTTAQNSSINISPNVGAFGGTLKANANLNATSNSTTTSRTLSKTTSTATAASTHSTASTATSASAAASSSSTGSPKDNAGAAIAGSGLLALLMAAVMA